MNYYRVIGFKQPDSFYNTIWDVLLRGSIISSDEIVNGNGRITVVEISPHINIVDTNRSAITYINNGQFKNIEVSNIIVEPVHPSEIGALLYEVDE